MLGSLGAGGMGEVYRARDTQAFGALNHPNIAQVYGFERDGDVRAIAMELVEGDDLSQIVARPGQRHGPGGLVDRH